jgi:hypothetical protein
LRQDKRAPLESDVNKKKKRGDKYGRSRQSARHPGRFRLILNG